MASVLLESPKTISADHRIPQVNVTHSDLNAAYEISKYLHSEKDLYSEKI